MSFLLNSVIISHVLSLLPSSTKRILLFSSTVPLFCISSRQERNSGAVIGRTSLSLKQGITKYKTGFKVIPPFFTNISYYLFLFNRTNLKFFLPFLKVCGIIDLYFRRHSSVGQSTCLTCKGSPVQVQLSPPKNPAAKAAGFFVLFIIHF